MKVIDLLIDITNDNKIPNRIRIKGKDFEFGNISSIETYYRPVGNNDEYWFDVMDIKLTDKVEIIEEEKEIEKGLKPYKQYVEELGKNGYGISEINEEYLDRLSKIVIELIEINKLKKEGK